MTPALSFYLLAAARAEPLLARRPPQAAADAWPLRTSDETVWIHLGTRQPAASAATLASRISDERVEAGFVITCDEPAMFGDELPAIARPIDFPRAVDRFLTAWRPSACVWIGGPIWPVLAARARQAGIPMLLTNATEALATGHRGVPARDLLGLFDRIAACTETDRRALQKACRITVESTGRLQQSLRPLEHDEAQRLRIAAAMQTRPVWFAANATAGEAEALRAAHAVGQSASHKLLLIVQPADAGAASAYLERYAVRRSAMGAPPPGASVFIADIPGEEGLWYRLASVSFIGGSLGGPAAMTDPFAPASLGSVVVHGPVLQPYARQFQALAGATRAVRDAAELGRAIEELLAADIAADLANRAWTAVSEGAEATDHVAAEVCRLLEEPR